MDTTKAVKGSRLAMFIETLSDDEIPKHPPKQHIAGNAEVFYHSDSKRPEFEGEYVPPIGTIPKKGPMRVQSRRRDLLWHFIATRRLNIHLRTADELAIVKFSGESSYKGLSDEEGFQTHRMRSMTKRQLELARKKTGNGSLDAFDTKTHALESWRDPRIRFALKYAEWCRVLRKDSIDRNTRNFLMGGPCKNLIYLMAFRQPNDPAAPVLIYIGQTTQTFADRMGEHFKAHATLVDLLCMTTPAQDVIAFVLDICSSGDDLDTLEHEAIAVFGGVSRYGANMVHGKIKK